MFRDIVDVQPLNHYRLQIRFEDGVQGVVDVRRLVSFTGPFARLTDPKEFMLVLLDRDLGTLRWPCGADLDPEMLYAHVTEQPLVETEAASD